MKTVSFIKCLELIKRSIIVCMHDFPKHKATSLHHGFVCAKLNCVWAKHYLLNHQHTHLLLLVKSSAGIFTWALTTTSS